jgi:hypothetical protein
MSSRTLNPYAIPAAAQCPRNHDVTSSAIQHHVSGDAAAQRRICIEGPHSAQISLPLFTDISHEEEIPRKFNSAASDRCGQGQQSSHSGSVVASPWRSQKMVVKEGLNDGFRGKYRIDVSGKNNARAARSSFPGRVGPTQHVSSFVQFHII